MCDIYNDRLAKGVAANDVASWLGLTINQYLAKEKGGQRSKIMKC